MDIEYGYCHCGCGEKTNLSKSTNPQKKQIKGQPLRFVKHHHMRKDNNPNWNGGSKARSDGYREILNPFHHRANNNGYVMEHIMVAEKALGRNLPPKAVIHHINGNMADNRQVNLVICHDNAYHKLIHRRQRAFNACGHASWYKCQFCQKYDEPGNMYIRPDNSQGYHRTCRNALLVKFHKK